MPVIKSEIMESHKRSEMIAFQINSSDISVDDLKVYVTNNGFDSTPIWEDATQELMTDDLYYFVNETKTSDKWGVGIKIVVGEENSPISMLLTYSPTEINNNKVVVTVNVNAECGLSYIKTPDGITHTISGTSNTLTYEITTNGNYTFEAKNTDGDTISKILTISNIDKTVPTITITPISTFDDFVDKVNVKISCSDDTALKELKLPDNTTKTITGKTYETTYEITSNGVYKFEVFDSVGNSTSESITINNIDGSAPTLELKVDITDITNSDVIITAIATDDTGLATIQKDDETATTISGTTNISTYTISENGTYTFVVTDGTGKSTTKSITINNIDKISPTIVLTQDATDTSIINISCADDVSLKTLKLPNGTTEDISGTTYETTYTVTQNKTYEFIVTDEAGNSTSESITIDNLVVAPTITVTPATTDYTNQSLTLTIDYADETGLASVRRHGGSTVSVDGVTTYQLTYVASSNGTYTFEATNVGGVKTTVTYTVSNIDKTSPTVSTSISPTTYTNGSVEITVTLKDSVGLKQITYPDGTIEELNGVTNTTVTYIATENTSYSFIAEDLAGNTKTSSRTISTIDTTAPAISSLTVNTTETVAGSVTVTLKCTDNKKLSTIEYTDGTTVSTVAISGTSKTSTITITKNGTYTFTVYDEAGNFVTSDELVINNIVPWVDATINDNDNVFSYNTKAFYPSTSPDEGLEVTLYDRGEGTTRTNWGDGIEDYALSHTYLTHGTYTIVTKHFIQSVTGGGTGYNNLKRFVGCSQISGDITDLSYFVGGCVNMTSLPSKLPSGVTNMKHAFNGVKVSTIPFTLPEGVTNCAGAFGGTSITTAPTLPSSITDCSSMFSNCPKLKTAPEMSHLINVTNCSSLFFQCTALTTVTNLPPNTTNLYLAFMNCTSLTTVPSNLIPNSVYRLYQTFSGCTKLTKAPILPQKAQTEGGATSAGVFSGCTSMTDITQENYKLMQKVASGTITPYYHGDAFTGCTKITSPDTYANLVANYPDWFD